MKFLETIITTIRQFEEKEFYKYLLALVVGVTLILGVIVVRYYMAINNLTQQLEEINDLREPQIKTILNKAAYVLKQRSEVNALLAQDENFKIAGYFKDVLTKLNLTDKETEETPSQAERDKEYRESILNASFAGITMKNLTELLDEIEHNKRVYTKELDINRSHTVPRTIDVSITIATLQPKNQAT